MCEIDPLVTLTSTFPLLGTLIIFRILMVYGRLSVGVQHAPGANQSANQWVEGVAATRDTPLNGCASSECFCGGFFLHRENMHGK